MKTISSKIIIINKLKSLRKIIITNKHKHNVKSLLETRKSSTKNLKIIFSEIIIENELKS